MPTDAANGTFQLNLPGFQGPFLELIQLAERRKLPADQLALSEITSQYRRHLDAAGEIDLQATGDFLRGAARLLVMKSELLLPCHETLQEPRSELVDLSVILADREGLREVASVLASQQGHESFPAPGRDLVQRKIEPRSPSLLRKAWDDLCSRTSAGVVRVKPPAFVRLEVALSRIIRSLAAGATVSLQRLLHGSSRNDAVIHFLAALELIRRRQATARQVELFGDIEIGPIDSEGGVRIKAG